MSSNACARMAYMSYYYSRPRQCGPANSAVSCDARVFNEAKSHSTLTNQQRRREGKTSLCSANNIILTLVESE